MLREAIDYPTRPPEGGRSVIVGGGLLVVIAAFVAITGLETPSAYLAILGVLPWLLVRGYYVRVVRTTIGRDRPTPPRFGDVRRLFVDGLTAIAVSVTYLLPGVVVLGPLVAVRVAGTDLSALLVAHAPNAIGVAVPIVVPVVGLLAVVASMYVLGALYVLPVAIARFAYARNVGAAFEFRTVLSGAVSEDYAIAWAISFVLQALLLPLAYLLRILLVGFFLQFVVVVGVRYCYGRGVGAALDLDSVPAAHERSDPRRWELRPAITRVDDSERGNAGVFERSERRLRPAITRVDDSGERSDR